MDRKALKPKPAKAWQFSYRGIRLVKGSCMKKALVSNALVLALLLGAATTPSFAQSKSQSVRVSCVIPTQIEIANPAGDRPFDASDVATNSQSLFQTTESWKMSDGQRMKVLTVTAL